MFYTHLIYICLFTFKVGSDDRRRFVFEVTADVPIFNVLEMALEII